MNNVEKNAETMIRERASKMAKAEKLAPFSELGLVLKFVKEYNEITFENFYTLKYNFVHNILLYEKEMNEYSDRYSNAYQNLKKQ